MRAETVYTFLATNHRESQMGKLTTHVLDTMHGCPAAGMVVSLHRLEGEAATLVKTVTLNADGRAEAPMLEGDALRIGSHGFGITNTCSRWCSARKRARRSAAIDPKSTRRGTPRVSLQMGHGTSNFDG